MRICLMLVLMLLLTGAGVNENRCADVDRYSVGRIVCTKDDFGYTLKYRDWITRKLTRSSEQYDNLILLLCHEGGAVRETWKQPFRGTQLRTTTCRELD